MLRIKCVVLDVGGSIVSDEAVAKALERGKACWPSPTIVSAKLTIVCRRGGERRGEKGRERERLRDRREFARGSLAKA